MARTLTEAPITTANARAKLASGLHWRGIDSEVHLGYRKGKRGGVWLVRWRNGTGYGFVIVESSDVSAFLHTSVLEKSKVAEVLDGDSVIVDIARSHKGIAVSNIRKAETSQPTKANLVDVVVVKIFHDRGYGFVHVPALEQDAFFHTSILPERERINAGVGTAFRAEVNEDPKGRGLQVRRIGA